MLYIGTVDVCIFFVFAIIPIMIGLYILSFILRVTNTWTYVTRLMNWVTNAVNSFYVAAFQNGGNPATSSPDDELRK
jgi:hypothetical protein